MLRRLSLLPTLSLCVALLTLSACGGGGTSSTGPIKPTPGGLLPLTPANEFMYLPRSTVMESNGDILIADSGDWDRAHAKVEELNPQGKPDWIYGGGLDFPHSAYPMSNGNILISDTGNDRVIEVNRKGHIVWNTDNFGGGGGLLGNGKLSNGVHLLYPNDAEPLSNGNILITSRYTNGVYEVTPTGKVVWQCSKFMNRQHNAQLLPNGNLIVADSDDARAIIINHSCTKVVFHYGPGQPAGNAIRWPRAFVPDGNNYIVGDSLGQRILEINREKQVVREWDNLPLPFYVSVLSNGNLLTQDSNIHGAVELGANGGTVKTFPTTDPNVYPSSVVNPSFNGTSGWLQGDLLTESLPAGQRADMKIDTSTNRPGSTGGSGEISWPTNTSHLALFWYQTIKVIPSHIYTFTGYIKTSKVTPCAGCDYGTGTTPGGSAYFSVLANSPNVSSTNSVDYPSGDVSGTQDWTQESFTVSVPAGVTSVQIRCNLSGQGTAWFDDVSLH